MSRIEGLRAQLSARSDEISSGLAPGLVGIGVYDYLSGFAWSRAGGRWFHAASTIKVAILAALFDAIERDRFQLDLIGVDEARGALARRGIAGVDLQRGVEDHRAFAIGCSNRVTPDGLVDLLRAIRDGRGFTPESSKAMMDILGDQQFAGGIGPSLPDSIRAVARVAHKTGDISTASHDAGIVFLPGRPPYVVAVLTESEGDAAVRLSALATVSGLVYHAVAAAGEAA
jgi:beta-lactamase class A